MKGIMLADINEILIISTLQYIGNFEELLGDGSDFGILLLKLVLI
ncbi:hypothetical protein [Sulfurimonas sp.]